MILGLSLLAGLLCGALASAACARARVPGGLAMGLLLATAILGVLQPSLGVGDLKPGPAVGPLVLAALPALLAAWWGDRRGKPSSERHLLGLLASGVLLAVAGLGVAMVREVEVSLAASMGLSVLWLLLVVGIAELVGFAPLGLFVLAWLAAILVGVGVGFDTAGAAMLAGVLAGGVTGRAAAHLVMGREEPWARCDTFAVGIWLAVATSASFLKSVAFVGLALPLGLVIAGLALASLHAFERTLVLRAAPGPGDGRGR